MTSNGRILQKILDIINCSYLPWRVVSLDISIFLGLSTNNSNLANTEPTN